MTDLLDDHITQLETDRAHLRAVLQHILDAWTEYIANPSAGNWDEVHNAIYTAYSASTITGTNERNTRKTHKDQERLERIQALYQRKLATHTNPVELSISDLKFLIERIVL